MSFKLFISPAFLILSFISYTMPSPLCVAPGGFGFLTSMWFMYLAMAVAHSGQWFALLPLLPKRSNFKISVR